jgi:hypothetical protein
MSTADRLAQRQRIYDRDSGRCGLCGEPVGFDEMHLDHRRPYIAGGTEDDDNLQPAHPDCNLRAGAKGQRRAPNFARTDRGTLFRVGPVTEPERGAINILTPEERRVVLLAAARAKAAGIVGDAPDPDPAPVGPATRPVRQQQ